MGALSDYLENKLLEHSMGKTAYTMPSGVYLGLFTTAPTDAAPGTEVTGGAYARQKVTFGNAAAGSISNSADVTFPKATANWGTITHAALFDAATAGNMLWHGALQAQKAIGIDDSFLIEAGKLTCSLD